MDPQELRLPHDALFESGFINYYSQYTSVSGFNKEQIKALTNHLNAPEVQAWLKELAINITRDLMRLDFTRSDDQLKLAAKYGQGRGALEVIEQLINQSKENVK